jgi:protein disulfide-isomerase A6
MFYSVFQVAGKSSLLAIKEVANVFQSENVTVGSINCQKFKDFCEEKGVDVHPTVKVYKFGNWTEFNGRDKVERLVTFVNEQCGTQRARGGLLNDVAGTILAADKLVRPFLKAEEKREIVEQMKAIPGAEFYVKVMERFIAKGSEQIQQDLDSMTAILDQRKGSIATLDGVKKRFNVMNKFVPVVTEPAPEEAELTPDDDAELAALDALLQEEDDFDL